MGVPGVVSLHAKTMTNLPVAETSLLTTWLLGMLALITLVALWRARGPAVYLWCGAGLCQSLGSALMPEVVSAGSTQQAGLIGAIAALTAAGAVGKASALRLIVAPALPLSLPAGMVLGFAALVTLLAAFWPTTPWAGVVSVGGVGLLLIPMGVFAWTAARRFDSTSGRALCVLTIAHGLLVILSAVVAGLSGRNPLAFEGLETNLGDFALVAVLPLGSAALFIGLMLDTYLGREAEGRQAVEKATARRLQSEERTRLLSDIHDGFGSYLTTARIRLDAADASREEAVALLDRCIADLQLTVDTLQEGSQNLADAFADFRYRCEQHLGQGSVHVEWDLDLTGCHALGSSHRLQILRIVQEALHNALRHASASQVWIRARCDRETREFALTVEDDGRGWPEPMPAGQGLRNLQRRARLCGGALELGTGSEGRGARVSLRVPLTA